MKKETVRTGGTVNLPAPKEKSAPPATSVKDTSTAKGGKTNKED